MTKRVLFFGGLVILCTFGYQATKKNALSNNSFVNVEWPLDRSGQSSVQLRIPSDYARADAFPAMLDRVVNHEGVPPKVSARIILFEVEWPSMRAVSGTDPLLMTSNNDALITATVASGALATTDGKKDDQLQKLFAIAEENAKRICLPTGLPVPQNVTCHSLSEPTSKQSEYGLKRVGIDFDKYAVENDDRGGIDENDIYTAFDIDGHPTTVILCTPYEYKKSNAGVMIHPQCEQHFIDSKLNALVSLSFSKSHLPQWREIQASWIVLLQSFQIKNR